MMMKGVIATTTVLAASASIALGAEGWGIDHEKEVRVEAKVVDLLCAVTGECTNNCGGGKRQLGLLFDDGRLVPVVKNFDIFAGATDDLQPFCGKRITADGLMISNPKMPLFALQFKRLAPDGTWSRANQFGKTWSAVNDGKEAGSWYKHDARVLGTLKESGVYGIPGLKPQE